MQKKFSDILAPVDVEALVGNGDILIEGIEYDSRKVKPGCLFVAIPGFKLDGKQFVAQAVENGAVAVVADAKVEVSVPLAVVKSPRAALPSLAAAFYDYPGNKLEAAAVTGTNGKSTAVALTGHILKAAGHKTGVINSLVYDTGSTKHKADRTTPESLDVQKYLYEMVQSGSTHAVVEVSSHALVLSRVENIDFKCGLFVTFSRDHLDFHKTMEEYLRAKQKLMYKLDGDNKRAVINDDAPEFRTFIKTALCPVVTYSAAGKPSDITIGRHKFYPDRTEFRMITPDGEYDAVIGLPGRYNMTNALGAASLAWAMGVDFDTIVRALKTASPVPGRFQPVDFGQPFTILIDFAHTSDALERVCRSAREITTGRLLTLFGCGGDRDRGKRPLMGAAASENSDFVIVTSDNPRTENPEDIIEEILPGIKGDNKIVIADRKQAIREMIARAKPGDMLIFAGKGAEDYQEIGTVKYPFSETEEIRQALIELGVTEEQPQ